MSMQISISRSIFVICGLLGACSGDAGPDVSPDSGGEQADAGGESGAAAKESYLTWRDQANRASCERRLRCDDPAPYPSVDACVDDFDADVLAAAPRIADSIEAGRSFFYAEWAEPCLEQYLQSCDAPFTDILIVCNRVYAGQRAVSEDCVGHFECINPEGPERSLCFDGCESLWGTEDELGSGLCVAESPIGSPACP